MSSITDPKYAFSFMGSPTTVEEQRKALASGGPLVIARDHLLYAIRNCPHPQECCRTRSNTRYAIRNVQQPPHSPRQSTRYAMRNTQYAAGATAGGLNTQIKRKIRSLLIRSVNRIAQVSAADKEKLCCPRKLPTSSHDPLNRVTTRKAAGVLTASPPPSAPTSPCGHARGISL